MEAEYSQINDFLQGIERVLSLRLCFHDRPAIEELAGLYRTHRAPCCLDVKRLREAECIKHDVRAIHRKLISGEGGIIETCPAGFTEIACPVYIHGLIGGVLFAGQFWTKRDDAPYGDLILCRNRGHLEDLREVISSCGLKLGRLLERSRSKTTNEGGYGRRQLISEFMAGSFRTDTRLPDLARYLHLSDSRTAHALKEIFGIGFSALLTRFRMQEAMRILSSTQLPVTEVAFMCGYQDSNYFSRVFHRKLGVSPREYRLRFRHKP